MTQHVLAQAQQCQVHQIRYNMEITSELTKRVLANTFIMYFKAQSYHWNIEGRNFAQDHAFFGELYEALHANVDTIAEEIRTLGDYAPISLMEMYNSKTIMEDEAKPVSFENMIMNLLDANSQVIASLNSLFTEASNVNNQGLADFAAGLLDSHAKHGWMLRSHLKAGE